MFGPADVAHSNIYVGRVAPTRALIYVSTAQIVSRPIRDNNKLKYLARNKSKSPAPNKRDCGKRALGSTMLEDESAENAGPGRAANNVDTLELVDLVSCVWLFV